MSKYFITVVLAVIAVLAIGAMIWALSLKLPGLMWFPGFFVAMCSIYAILEIAGAGNKENA